MSIQRIDEGNLTVNLQDLEWQTVVIKQARDRTALRNMVDMLNKIHTGNSANGEEGENILKLETGLSLLIDTTIQLVKFL